MHSFSGRFDLVFPGPSAAKPMLVTERHSVTYGQLSDTIGRLWSFLPELGLSVGDRVGILAREPADISALVLAGMRFGIGVVVLNPEMTAEEVERAIAACQLSHVFHEVGSLVQRTVPESVACTRFVAASRAGGGGGLLGRLRRSTPDAGPKPLSAVLDAFDVAGAPPHPDPQTVALLLYTSGTTSRPKVVELTHLNISTQLDAFDQVYDYADDCRILNPLPLHFTDGLFHGPISTFLAGATLFRPTEFNISKLEDLLNNVYRERITHLIVVPAILALMDRLGKEYHDTFTSGSFRYIRSSGDRLPTSLWHSIEARYGTRVVNTYGMSETVCEAFYSGPGDDLRKVGTVGKAVGCTWKIVGETGETLDAGETGELLIGGNIIARGYLGNPELTAQAFEDGWLRTGDLATAHQDGFVTISGRSKDLIISGGVNIHPQEVTDCLLECDGVADAIAFGLPHGVWGEQVAAAICARPGAGLDRHQILQYCLDRLAPHKVPRILTFVDSLPRNAAGKILVKQLRAECQAMDMSRGSSSEASLADQVIEQASEVFGVSAADLSLQAEPATTPGWDSFAHLTLITALEARFDLTFSAQEILRVDSLSHLVDLLVARQSRVPEGQALTVQ